MTAALEVTVARQIGEFELDVAFTVESGMSVSGKTLFAGSNDGNLYALQI